MVPPYLDIIEMSWSISVVLWYLVSQCKHRLRYSDSFERRHGSWCQTDAYSISDIVGTFEIPPTMVSLVCRQYWIESITAHQGSLATITYANRQTMLAQTTSKCNAEGIRCICYVFLYFDKNKTFWSNASRWIKRSEYTNCNEK